MTWITQVRPQYNSIVFCLMWSCVFEWQSMYMCECCRQCVSIHRDIAGDVKTGQASCITLTQAICHVVVVFNSTGTTNMFQINTSHDLAILYNDKAVLENHHAATAFKLLQDPQLNFLCNLGPEQYKEFREAAIEMVLATDMTHHVKHMAKFTTTAENKEAGDKRWDIASKEDRMLLLTTALHCADLSNPTKPLSVYSRWTERVMKEFFDQGDREKELGLPVSPGMDRSKVTIPKAQIGFIDFIVDPLYRSWKIFCKEAQVCLDHLAVNRRHWEDRAKFESTK
eukprot:GFYU01003740.1.p1 GENE.GFYU01003740.1~~GFYU01003740.1.p1  ORF type:complete len:283 (+),score=71.31 GFYU01003740.1:1149-1997(+)